MAQSFNVTSNSQIVTHNLQINKTRFTLMLVSFPSIINWNLAGFGFNEFNMNHFKIYSISNLRLCNILRKTFPHELKVSSLGKLHISNFETKKSIPFMRMLNNKGPGVDPCGIPQIASCQSLKLEPIFVHHL